MSTALNEAALAQLPLQRLPFLSVLRAHADVLVTVLDQTAWIAWPAGDSDVIAALLSVPGVVLYRWRLGKWFRLGEELPAGDAPGLHGKQVGDVLVPAPVRPREPAQIPRARLTLQLVPASHVQATTAIRTELETLEAWAEAQPAVILQRIRAARLGRQVLLLGERLPLLDGGERFWGDRLLLPLGFAPEPALAENVLLPALGVGAEELLLCSDNAEIVPRDRFRPLTRSSLRLARRGEAAWTP